MSVSNKSCIIRLSQYRNAIIRLEALNFVRVFSDNLADAAGATAAQVRKDFSLFGITGNRRGGYRVSELLRRLDKILSKEHVQEVILVGAGNIGRALMQYPGFEKNGIRIVAGFDIDPAKYNEQARVPVLPLEKMNDYIVSHNIQYGIIAVPDYAAQQVLELMNNADIKGVLNFAPICLRESANCTVSNINLVTELENVIYFARVRQSIQPG